MSPDGLPADDAHIAGQGHLDLGAQTVADAGRLELDGVAVDVVPAARGVGDTGGMCVPSALLTGFEKVSVIGVEGLIVAPGVGLATAVAELPAGN